MDGVSITHLTETPEPYLLFTRESRNDLHRIQKEGGKEYEKIYLCNRRRCIGLGKGITAASLGRLLKARGLRIAAQKLDPYINVDPGTMSPFQHGEVL